MLAITAVLLLISMSWATGGWTGGEATERNDDLVRLVLLGAVTCVAAWMALRRRDRLRHAGERARRERLRQSVRGQVAVFGWCGIAVDIGPGGRW